MPFHLLVNPTVRDVSPLPKQRLGRWFGTTVALSVLKHGPGSYTTVHAPDEDQIAAAEFAYLGGYRWLVSDDEAAALTAAGYTVVDTYEDRVDDLFGYGYGPYGHGHFGGLTP